MDEFITERVTAWRDDTAPDGSVAPTSVLDQS